MICRSTTSQTTMMTMTVLAEHSQANVQIVSSHHHLSQCLFCLYFRLINVVIITFLINCKILGVVIITLQNKEILTHHAPFFTLRNPIPFKIRQVACWFFYFYFYHYIVKYSDAIIKDDVYVYLISSLLNLHHNCAICYDYFQISTYSHILPTFLSLKVKKIINYPR